MTDDVEGRLRDVRARIAAACARANRGENEVKLVAVTKGVSIDRIARAAACGVTDFGENRVQELTEKTRAFANAKEMRWHMIGTLQRNKVSRVAGKVALIHGADSIELLHAIDARARKANIVQAVLLQANVSGEPAKHGWAPDEVPGAMKAARALEGIQVQGLMTIAPEGDIQTARKCFRELRALRDSLELDELSMGMSGDFEAAIEEGATIVRVGSAIFGPRPG